MVLCTITAQVKDKKALATTKAAISQLLRLGHKNQGVMAAIKYSVTASNVRLSALYRSMARNIVFLGKIILYQQECVCKLKISKLYMLSHIALVLQAISSLESPVLNNLSRGQRHV